MKLGGINCLEILCNQTQPEVEKVCIFHLLQSFYAKLGLSSTPLSNMNCSVVMAWLCISASKLDSGFSLLNNRISPFAGPVL